MPSIAFENEANAFLAAVKERITMGTHPSKVHTEFRHSPPGSEKEAWQECAQLVARYDKSMCDAYREHIDTLLVFAGLFSAVVTAFAAESYSWLQASSSDDTVVLLAHIATVLAQHLPANASHTLSPPATPSASGLPEAASIRINVYWFLSLTLSLSCALIAILAKQWVREYERDYGLSHTQALAVRQMKFEGLQAWRVNDIVSFLPLVLQLALALFLTGVIELLWRLNAALAIAVTSVAAIVLGLYLATTLLPAAYIAHWHCKPDAEQSTAVQCPYKSPQAWLALQAFLPCLNFLFPRGHEISKLYNAQSWGSFDSAWTALCDSRKAPQAESAFRALAWLVRVMDTSSLYTWIWHCLWSRVSPSPDAENSEHSRALYDVECVLDELGPLSPRVGAFLSHAIHEDMASQWSLWEYSLRADADPDVLAELLIRLIYAGNRTDPWVVDCLGYILSKYKYCDAAIGDGLAEPLFQIISELVDNAEELRAVRKELGDLLEEFVKALSIEDCAADRPCLILAVCPLATRWLRSGCCDTQSAEDWDVFKARNILYQVCLRLGGLDLSQLEMHEGLGVKESHILVLASLADAIVEVWERLLPDRTLPPKERHFISQPFEDLCEELISIAFETYPDAASRSSAPESRSSAPAKKRSTSNPSASASLSSVVSHGPTSPNLRGRNSTSSATRLLRRVPMRRSQAGIAADRGPGVPTGRPDGNRTMSLQSSSGSVRREYGSETAYLREDGASLREEEEGTPAVSELGLAEAPQRPGPPDSAELIRGSTKLQEGTFISVENAGQPFAAVSLPESAAQENTASASNDDQEVPSLADLQFSYPRGPSDENWDALERGGL